MDDNVLECPACGAFVPYDDVGEPEQDGMCGCPYCFEITPTDDWFA